MRFADELVSGSELDVNEPGRRPSKR
jgi:hypothetical protein